MFNEIKESFGIVKKCMVPAVKLQVEDFVFTILLTLTGITAGLIGIAIGLIIFNGSMIAIAALLIMSALVFFTLFNSKRMAYCYSIEYLKAKKESHFYVYMREFLSHLGNGLKIAGIQTIMLVGASVIIAIALVAGEITDLNVNIAMSAIAITGIMFVNELVLTPLLIIMAVTNKGVRASLRVFFSKILKLLFSRIIYLIIMFAILGITTVFGFLLFPPLLFGLLLYLILMMAHISDYMKKTGIRFKVE